MRQDNMSSSAYDNEKVINVVDEAKESKNSKLQFAVIFSQNQPSTFISAPKPLRSAHSAIMQIVVICCKFLLVYSSSFYELFYTFSSPLTCILDFFRHRRGVVVNTKHKKTARELRAAWIGVKLWDAGNNINRFKDDNEYWDTPRQTNYSAYLTITCINNKRSKFDKVYERKIRNFSFFFQNTNEK